MLHSVFSRVTCANDEFGFSLCLCRLGLVLQWLLQRSDPPTDQRNLNLSPAVRICTSSHCTALHCTIAPLPSCTTYCPLFCPGLCHTAWEESVSKLIRAYKICVKDAGLKDSQFGDILKLLNRTLSPPEDEYDAKTEAPPVPKKLILTSPVVGFDPMAFRALTVAMTAVKYSVCTAICIWNADIGDAGAIDLSKALPVMPQCTKLEIFHSLVGPTGVEAIANACLRKRKTSYLQILRLDHNPIGSFPARRCLPLPLCADCLRA